MQKHKTQQVRTRFVDKPHYSGPEAYKNHPWRNPYRKGENQVLPDNELKPSIMRPWCLSQLDTWLNDPYYPDRKEWPCLYLQKMDGWSLRLNYKKLPVYTQDSDGKFKWKDIFKLSIVTSSNNTLNLSPDLERELTIYCHKMYPDGVEMGLEAAMHLQSTPDQLSKIPQFRNCKSTHPFSYVSSIMTKVVGDPRKKQKLHFNNPTNENQCKIPIITLHDSGKKALALCLYVFRVIPTDNENELAKTTWDNWLQKHTDMQKQLQQERKWSIVFDLIQPPPTLELQTQGNVRRADKLEDLMQVYDYLHSRSTIRLPMPREGFVADWGPCSEKNNRGQQSDNPQKQGVSQYRLKFISVIRIWVKINSVTSRGFYWKPIYKSEFDSCLEDALPIRGSLFLDNQNESDSEAEDLQADDSESDAESTRSSVADSSTQGAAKRFSISQVKARFQRNKQRIRHEGVYLVTVTAWHFHHIFERPYKPQHGTATLEGDTYFLNDNSDFRHFIQVSGFYDCNLKRYFNLSAKKRNFKTMIGKELVPNSQYQEFWLVGKDEENNYIVCERQKVVRGNGYMGYNLVNCQIVRSVQGQLTNSLKFVESEKNWTKWTTLNAAKTLVFPSSDDHELFAVEYPNIVNKYLRVTRWVNVTIHQDRENACVATQGSIPNFVTDLYDPSETKRQKIVDLTGYNFSSRHFSKAWTEASLQCQSIALMMLKKTKNAHGHVMYRIPTIKKELDRIEDYLETLAPDNVKRKRNRSGVIVLDREFSLFKICENSIYKV